MGQTMIIQKVNICEEEPVDLILNGKRIVTFMCTPKDLRELAIGHLYSRGLINDIRELYALAACDDMSRIYGVTSKKIDMEGYDLNTILSSCCGSGSGERFNEKLYEIPQNKSPFQVSMKKIKELTIKMFSMAEMYKNLGGMHCAAIANGDGIIALREDVGRHNAVDKIIGKGLLLEIDFSKLMIMTTGRISSDMILKSSNVRCPIIVSRSIPTTLAIELAEKLGITIIGRAVSSRPIVYTHKQRLID